VTGSFFEVHLQSLEDFGRVLEAQLSALPLPVDKLAPLTEAPPPLGQFAEALALGERHRLAAEQMAALLGSVRRAVEFAAGVTDAVATSYRTHDERAAAAYRSAGTVYYSAGSA
jgi:hypothetical protein